MGWIVAAAVAGALLGAFGGWRASAFVRQRPARVAGVVFAVALVGLGGFIAISIAGVPVVAYGVLGACAGALSGLKWGVSEAFGALSPRPDDLQAPGRDDSRIARR